jgi:hypothetical protein
MALHPLPLVVGKTKGHHPGLDDGLWSVPPWTSGSHPTSDTVFRFRRVRGLSVGRMRGMPPTGARIVHGAAGGAAAVATDALVTS